MKTRIALGCAAVLASALALPAHGAEPAPAPAMTPEQQKMMETYMRAAAPGPEHERLAKMAGTWKLVITDYSGPTPADDEGTAVYTVGLGGRVLTQSVTSSMNGMPFQGMGIEGYDNVGKKYWSVWNDSLSTGPMIAWGTCDGAGSCSYEGSVNDPMTGKPAKVRMTLRADGADRRIFEFYGTGPDGKEAQMMRIVYTRQQ